MSKEENVVKYYVLCNSLKNVIRSGWKSWNVKRDRIESIAEHIFGTQMLAIAMKSEYNYDLDIMKVIYMLAIHELGEILIGDYMPFEISIEEKRKIEHEAVHKILSGLIDGKQIEELFLEFDDHKTKEAIFAFECDKLECNIQCKLYDEENCVDLSNQNNNDLVNEKDIHKYLNNNTSWSEMWLKIGQERYNYDKNFLDVSNYALNNKINVFKNENE